MIAIIILWAFLALSCVFVLIKNEVTYQNRILINKAIFKYQISLIEQHIYENEVDYSDMEDYNKTLSRILDWGYKRILPKEKFEIIEPFVEHKKGKYK